MRPFLLLFGILALIGFVSQAGRIPAIIFLNAPSLDALDEENIRRSASPRDIIFGGDVKRLAKSAKRLRAMATSPDEPALYNRLLHVAIVDSPPSVKDQKEAPEIALDLGRAGAAAVLVIAAGPTVWRIENARPEQRAKIAFEGPSPFDLKNAPEHILAGFRVGAFGADDFTSPRDYLENHGPARTRRYCAAMEKWKKLFDAAPRQMRIFVFQSPDRIEVNEEFLGGSPPPKSSPNWTVGQECHRYAESDK